MKKANNTNSSAAKKLSLTAPKDCDHNYSSPMETDSVSNKRERLATPVHTPEKHLTEKRVKVTSQGNGSNITMEDLLAAINNLAERVDKRMEEHGSMLEGHGSMLEQHGSVLASIAKAVQSNSEELVDCQTKIKHLENQVESLSKQNSDIKDKLLNQERNKRRCCLRIKGKREKVKENIREEVLDLLGKIAPELKMKMDEAVDVVHRVGRITEGRHRPVIIVFTRRSMRDEIWRRTKVSAVCKEEGIRFAEDLVQEDWKTRQALWPKILQARKDGKVAGYRGPFGFIEGKRISAEE